MTLLTEYRGPDGLAWQAHEAFRDAFGRHVLLVPPDESFESAGWWVLGPSDAPEYITPEFWQKWAGIGYPRLPGWQDAFQVPGGGAVWALRAHVLTDGGPMIEFGELVGDETPVRVVLAAADGPPEAMGREDLRRVWKSVSSARVEPNAVAAGD